MEYNYEQEMLKKAKSYAAVANKMNSSSMDISSTTVINELAIECYLCAILENETQKSVDEIYGKGNVPHDLFQLYNDIYKYDDNKLLPMFDRTLRKELSGAFKDYNAARFPKPDIYVIVDEESVNFNISLMQDIEQLAENYIKSLKALKSKSHPLIEEETR